MDDVGLVVEVAEALEDGDEDGAGVRLGVLAPVGIAGVEREERGVRGRAGYARGVGGQWLPCRGVWGGGRFGAPGAAGAEGGRTFS